MPRGASPEFMKMIGTRHGLARHPLYNTHRGMMRRCYDQDHHAFANYGGRGVKVCPEWHAVAEFVAWIETHLGPRPAGHTLDRIENDGNYEPGNVRWATRREQVANMRLRPDDWTPPADRSEVNRRYYQANRDRILGQQQGRRQTARL